MTPVYLFLIAALFIVFPFFFSPPSLLPRFRTCVTIALAMGNLYPPLDVGGSTRPGYLPTLSFPILLLELPPFLPQMKNRQPCVTTSDAKVLFVARHFRVYNDKQPRAVGNATDRG